MTQRPARRWARRVLAAALLAGLGLAAGVAADLYSIRADLDHGRSQLSDLSLDELRRSGLEPTIADAAAALRSAAERAESSPFLKVAGSVPLLGGQVDALRDLTSATDDLGREALTSGTRIEAALDRAGGDPGARVELLDVVLDELDRIEAVAADVDVGADGSLVGPLRGARADVVDALESVPERFAPLEVQVTALRDLLEGPSTYLLTVGNNAEMRAGTGMPLSAGLATIENGDLQLGDFEAVTSTMFTHEPTGRHNANISAPLRETYPRWLIGKDFPETAVVPHFPVTAPIYADIAADTQDWVTEGVIHIDAIALAQLLEVVGPVTVFGVEYTPETAPEIVLNQVYIAADGVPRALRRDAQSALAKALFEAIEQRDLELLDVISSLQRSAEGRHLMAWSRDGTLQELFESFGASGEVAPHETLVSVQNTGANKLDWYIRPSVDVEAEPLQASDEWLVTLTVTVSHPDRPLTVDYIEGPFPELAGGKHRTLVTVQVPTVATVIDMPDEEVTEYGHDGTSWVIGTRVVVERGEDRQIVTRFRLPRSFPGLAVVPSARAFPVPWTVEGARFADAKRFVAGFGEFPEPRDRRQVVLSSMGAIVALAGAATLLMGARRRRHHPELADLDVRTGIGLIAAAVLLGAGASLLF